MARAELTDQNAPSSELPILAFRKDIMQSIAQNPITMIMGEPGCGKTTQTPQMVLDALGPDRKIAITQPRRVAARTIAAYTAKQRGVPLGEDIGYRVRFEDATTEGTRLTFMTDGILLRKLQSDPQLKQYDAVMVDEAHERGINIDFTIGLLRNAQQTRRQSGERPLKIIISSATLEKDKFKKYFQGASMIEVPGRTFPVALHYASETPSKIEDTIKLATETAQNIWRRSRQNGGDILIFMPGVSEIEKTMQALENAKLQDCEILPLHGQLNPRDQDRIFTRSGKRRIIVATNIAETSVTIEGVRHVIDSGLIKETVFNQRSGIEALVTSKHSKSGCIQRAGRAGRVAPGDCWRLYTEEDFEQRNRFSTPEILRSNLAHVLLLMKDSGISNLKTFPFIDAPPTTAVMHATETLQILGALDEKGELTETGKLMAKLPLEPHLSRMILEAKEYNCTETVATICAMMTDRPVMSARFTSDIAAFEAYRRFQVPGSDFLTLLNVWRAFAKNDYSARWAINNHLDSQSLEEARQTRTQLLGILNTHQIPVVSSQDSAAVAKSIAAGLVENLLYKENNSYTRVKDNRRGIDIHPSSVMVDTPSQFMVTAEIANTSRVFAIMCQAFSPEWIQDIARHLVDKRPSSAYYDPVADKVLGQVVFYIPHTYKILAQFKEEIEGQRAVSAFAQYLSKNDKTFSFGQENKAVLDLADKIWLKVGNDKLPQYGSSFDLALFYTRRLGSTGNIQTLTDALEKGDINLFLNLNEIVPPHIQEHINSQNPDTVKVGDQEFLVSYQKDGRVFGATLQLPVSAVFRMSALPRIPSGKPLKIEIIDEGGNVLNQFRKPDIRSMQRQLADEYMAQQWSIWLGAYKNEIKSYPFSGNFGSLPDLPKPVPFGNNPQNGDELLAYPAFKLTRQKDGGYELQLTYYNSASEAQYQQKTTREDITDVIKILEERGR